MAHKFANLPAAALAALLLFPNAARTAEPITIGFGMGLAHNYVLEVRGRKSGRIYSAPIDLLEFEGRRYLVAPRGETQWVRNARAAGRVTHPFCLLYTSPSPRD